MLSSWPTGSRQSVRPAPWHIQRAPQRHGCRPTLIDANEPDAHRGCGKEPVQQDEHRGQRVINQALRCQLVVVHELGFLPFSEVGGQLMFQFCSALHERVALLVTTNLRFADWTQVFGNERMTAALLDRLTHRAHIVEFVGESFRFRQRLQRTRGSST